MKKKILICLLTFGIVVVLLFFGCKTSEEIVYDITGNWQFTLTNDISGASVSVFGFSGTLTSGTSTDITDGYTGTYTVTGTNVQFTLSWTTTGCGDITETYTGTFNSTTSMSGSYNFSATGLCWVTGTTTWTAVKL